MFISFPAAPNTLRHFGNVIGLIIASPEMNVSKKLNYFNLNYMETTINTELPADYCNFTKTQKMSYLETLIFPQGSFKSIDELFEGLEKRCHEIDDAESHKASSILEKLSKDK
jgi:hypothetical protein